jgi:uncharacterized membrane protein YfcA
MGADVIMLIIAGAFAGGFANGLAGFGTGLFALGWWLAAMPPLDAVITVVIMSLVGGVQGLYAVRNAIDFGEQLRFLAPASIGIMLGYLFLDTVNVTMLKLLVASLLIPVWRLFHLSKDVAKTDQTVSCCRCFCWVCWWVFWHDGGNVRGNFDDGLFAL